MTRCLKCKSSFSVQSKLRWEFSCSWDTRQKGPTSSLQPHDQEILAVAFNPGAETLLITGSADKVRLQNCGATRMADNWFLNRRSCCTISKGWGNHCTRSRHIRTRCCTSHGPHIAPPFSHLRRATAALMCGISHKSVSSRRQTIRKMARLNSCSFTVVRLQCLFVRTEHHLRSLPAGHTARPSDFCWAPGVGEHWTAVSTSEDNVVMVWQPTMHVWAGEEVHIEEKQLETEQMEGVEITGASGSGAGRGTGSGMQSAPRSGSASASGGDMDES
jgi:histone-binding protein RBBP4